MKTDKRLVAISKFLSKHLRHQPEALGLTLEAGGWAKVDLLLAAAAARGFAIARRELEQVVAQSDKQRFSFDSSGARIRANQGHSTPVDLQLEQAVPPEELFHGTAVQFLNAIWAEGLQKMSRHHVHLSGDRDTAEKVGRRRGPAIVLTVAAGHMAADGFTFWRSTNGVWLADHVPPRYLQVAP